MFTSSRLDRLPHKGRNQHLSVTPPHNPQPLVDGPESYFLYGPAGMPGGMEYGDDGRGRVHDDVYGFWVDNGRGVVVSCPSSLPFQTHTRTCGTGRSTHTTLARRSGTWAGWVIVSSAAGTRFELTSDVTDWERLRVRTVNGTAQSADFSESHSSEGAFISPRLWANLHQTPIQAAPSVRAHTAGLISSG